MIKSLLLILVIAATICLIATAGCTNAYAPATCPGILATVTASQIYPAVSINATPVKYAEVNGITLGYREF